MRRLCVVVGVLAGTIGLLAVTQRPPAAQRNFVACPIVRDTATLPCWLAEDHGELYYLGTQGSTSSAFYPPQLMHDVLVEATLGDGPRVCGGLPLTKVEVSVMPELNKACATMLPAEAAYSAPPSPPAPIPAFADGPREFAVPYDFDSDFLTLHTTRIVAEVARIAALAKPTRVEVHGHRGATLLSNGATRIERPAMGEVRATKMGTMLVDLGLPVGAVHVSWQTTPDPPDGVSDAARRRVTIRFRE